MVFDKINGFLNRPQVSVGVTAIYLLSVVSFVFYPPLINALLGVSLPFGATTGHLFGVFAGYVAVVKLFNRTN